MEARRGLRTAFHCFDCLQESLVPGKRNKGNEPACQRCWGDLYRGTRDDFMRLIAGNARRNLEKSVGTMIRVRLPTCRN